MTKREFFAQVSNIEEVANNAEMMEVINKEIASLDKKAAASKAAREKKAAENDKVKVDILNVLEGSEPLSATDIANSIGLTVQKTSSVLKTMVEEDRTVIRTTREKKKTFYGAAV